MSDSQYIVSARKYRPTNFKSVVGQKNLTETLKNAIDSGRLAQAYLFCGPRGVGKTSCARIFAKTINCLSPTPDGEACGQCESCRAVDEGNSFNIIELDAASNNSVDDIRNLTDQVRVPPTTGKYRVFIIDEVHMLSQAAFNAFLKTLEEPPSYVIFILATTEKHKVIPTILSRCQIYDFKRITIQDMVEHLQYVASSEGIEADVPSLNVISKKADGAMRDALSIFDQVAASSFGKITYESTIASLNVLDYEFYFRLVETFKAGDVPQALLIYKEIRDRGFDSLFFINGLAAHIRDLMVAFAPQTVTLLEVADDVAARYTEQARSLPVQWHYAAMKLLNACDTEYRVSSNKQFLVELTLIRLCQLLNPPTPPFDRVDSDLTPLRDPADPPQAGTYSSASTVASPLPENQVHSSPTPASEPTKVPEHVTSAPPSVTSPSADPSTSAHQPSEPTIPSGTHDSPSVSVSPQSPAPAPSGEGRKTVRGRRKEGQSNISGKTEITIDSLQRPREKVELTDFLKFWQEYMHRNEDKHILISAMRKGNPEKINEETFRVTVDHPALRQAYETAMTDLMEYLRDNLHNDFLTLQVDIDTSNVVEMLGPKELLKDILDSNPTIAQFVASIDGELS